MTISVACLIVTNRPAWRPWVLHQIYKQEGNLAKKVVIVDDDGSIPAKRNRALEDMRWDNGEADWDPDYVAFFDDDDWSHRLRLHWATDTMEQNPSIDAVGNVRSYFVNALEELTSSPPGYRCLPYQAPEGIIFNGAVFRTSAIRGLRFDEGCSIGEDTEWLVRWMTTRRPNYTVLGGPMSMWLCHRHNTTNRASERSFPESMRLGPLITEEEWALVPR